MYLCIPKVIKIKKYLVCTIKWILLDYFISIVEILKSVMLPEGNRLIMIVC